MTSFLPYGRHRVDDDDIVAVISVLKGDWLTTGPAVGAFESAFADFVGARYAVACSSGTAGLHLAALALGLGPGDGVVVPTMTFLATANAARYVGADVTFADVDAATGLMDMNARSRVAAVIVTHHSAAVIGPCLDSIRGMGWIIVVDNASDDETRDIVAMRAPEAELIRNAVGVGYGNGANQGLARVTCEFALMVNPDSVLRPDAVDELVAAADRYPDAAMFGPTLLGPSGAVEPSHDVSLFDRRRFGKRRGESPPDGDCSAASLSGAVVLLRMAVLREIGFFDPNLFLYYDDDDMCMRMAAAGHCPVLVPSAVAEHRGGGSVRPSAGYYWEKFWHMAWSRLYIEEKYHGAAAMRRIGLANALTYAVKAAAHAITLNRAKARRDVARTVGTLAYLAGVPALRDNLRS